MYCCCYCWSWYTLDFILCRSVLVEIVIIEFMYCWHFVSSEMKKKCVCFAIEKSHYDWKEWELNCFEQIGLKHLVWEQMNMLALLNWNFCVCYHCGSCDISLLLAVTTSSSRNTIKEKLCLINKVVEITWYHINKNGPWREIQTL